jgi:hypothetical protein
LLLLNNYFHHRDGTHGAGTFALAAPSFALGSKAEFGINLSNSDVDQGLGIPLHRQDGSGRAYL